jgi:hypothetical protein
MAFRHFVFPGVEQKHDEPDIHSQRAHQQNPGRNRVVEQINIPPPQQQIQGKNKVASNFTEFFVLKDTSKSKGHKQEVESIRVQKYRSEQQTHIDQSGQRSS